MAQEEPKRLRLGDLLPEVKQTGIEFRRKYFFAFAKKALICLPNNLSTALGVGEIVS